MPEPTGVSERERLGPGGGVGQMADVDHTRAAEGSPADEQVEPGDRVLDDLVVVQVVDGVGHLRYAQVEAQDLLELRHAGCVRCAEQFGFVQHLEHVAMASRAVDLGQELLDVRQAGSLTGDRREWLHADGHRRCGVAGRGHEGEDDCDDEERAASDPHSVRSMNHRAPHRRRFYHARYLHRVPRRLSARLVLVLAVAWCTGCDRPPSVGESLPEGPSSPNQIEAEPTAPADPPDPAKPAEADGSAESPVRPPPVSPDWERLTLVAPRMTAGTEAIQAQDWTRAAVEFRAAAAELGDATGLAGFVDQNLYNAACALALSGRHDEALDELERALEHGYRLVTTRLPDGRTLWSPGLAPSHVLVDPDLDALHDHPRWKALVARRFEAERLVVEPAEAGSAARPALLVLAAVGATAEASLPPWRIALRETEVVLAGLEGPVRVGEGERDGAGAWVLADGDERWGRAAILRAVESLAARPDVDPHAIHVVAHEGTGGRAGWAAALGDGTAFAGVAFPGAAFHRHAHQDALLRLADERAEVPPLVALLLPGRDALGAQLTDAGVVVRTLVPHDDVERVARGITDGLGLTSR